MIRKPAVSGTFYPGEKNILDKLVSNLTSAKTENDNIVGVLAPHAGYLYSGKVAGLTFGTIKIPEKVIIVGPNHTGAGAPVSIMAQGSWEMPSGRITVDNDLAQKIIDASQNIINDAAAHIREHSIEVQLPFIIYKNPEVSFVPIAMRDQSIEAVEELGNAIGAAVESTSERVLLVASSDMSHYISKEDAEYYDSMAIKKMESLDYKGLLKVVADNRISMCGAGPAAAIIKASVLSGAEKGELIHYNTSAEVSGDTTQVVGYAGIKFLK